jgi:hypothetical protein
VGGNPDQFACLFWRMNRSFRSNLMKMILRHCSSKAHFFADKTFAKFLLLNNSSDDVICRNLAFCCRDDEAENDRVCGRLGRRRRTLLASRLES